MRPELETYQLIDRYLNGELGGEELSSFEAKMKSETDFAQEIELQKLTNSVIAGAAYDKLRAQMKADIRALDAKKMASKSIWRRVIAGSSIAICAGFGYYFYTSSENVLEKVQATDSQSDISVSEASEVTPKIAISEKKVEEKIERATLPRTSSKRELKVEQEAKQIESPLVAQSLESEAVKPAEMPITHSKVPTQREPEIISHKAIQESSHIHALSQKEEKHVKKESVKPEEVEMQEKHSTQTVHTVHSSSGETWKIPVEQGKEYTVQVFNSAGVQVFKHSSQNSHLTEWDGTASNGALLEAGIYVYIIEYVNGTKETGQITIVK